MSFYPESVIADVNSQVDPVRLLELIGYKTNKIQETPEVVKGFCPIHRESVFRTLTVDRATRTFKCTYSLCDGAGGGSLIDLYAMAQQMAFDDAVKALAQEFGVELRLPVDADFLKKNAEVAENYLTLGETEEAEKLFRELAELQPEFMPAHEGLLRVALERGDRTGEVRARRSLARLHAARREWEKATEQAQKWLELEPESGEAKAVLAECTLASGDVEAAMYEFMAVADQCEAHEDFSGAVAAYLRADELQRELGVDVVDVHHHVVRAWQAAGRTQDAIEYLINRGERAARETQFERAVDLYAAAMELDEERLDLRMRYAELAALAEPGPESADRIVTVTTFLAEREEYERAMEALENYLARVPDDPKVMSRLAELYFSQGRNIEGGDLEVRLARQEIAAGDPHAARERMARILEWQPEHAGVLEALGDAEEALGNGAQARNARRRFAKVLAGQKDFKKALQVLDRLLEEDPLTMDLLEQQAQTLEAWGKAAGPEEALHQASEIYAQLADRMLEQTAGHRATLYLERAVSLGPADPVLMFRLARTYQRTGSLPMARDAVVRACEMLVGQGRLDDAILEAEQFAETMRWDLDLVLYAAELYLRMEDPEGAVAKLREVAQEKSRTGERGEAEQLFSQALQIRPDDFATLEALAEHYRAGGDLERFADTLRKASTIYEERCDLGGALKPLEALVAVQSGDLQAVSRLIEFNEKLKRLAEAQRWRMHAAQIYREAGDREREARVLREALQKSPADPEILALLAEAEFARGEKAAAVKASRRVAQIQREADREEEARATLESLLERVPGDTDVLRDLFALLKKIDRAAAAPRGAELAERLAEAGQPGEASLVFEEAAACVPHDVDMTLRRIEMLKSLGRDAEVMDCRIALARAYQHHERFREAEAVLNELLEADPQLTGAREELVELYGRLGDSARVEEQLTLLADSLVAEGESGKSVAVLQRILQLNPESIGARRQLILHYRDHGPVSEAVRELHLLADLYRRQGSEDEALAAERDAVQMSGDVKARRRLVDGLLKAGKQTQAAEELEMLAKTYLDALQFEEAEAALREVLEIDPDRLSARQLRGELFHRQGDSTRALEEYRAALSLAAFSGGNRPGTAANQTPSAGGELMLVPEYDFDRFVVGQNNQFAHATCLAIARSPGRQYNPLFLYADVGLGKTHLANAIANYVLARDSRARVIYTNSEDFTNELVEAISTNSVNMFRGRYKNCELLIVDDVQFLAGKQRAQEEFFHIFNALFQAKRQIVVTSDRPPAEIAHLENRLRSRFGAGVIVDIAPPDLETRVAILNREVDLGNLSLDPGVIRVIAERVDTNVRELKGALNQVIAMRDLRGVEATEENVRQMLDSLFARA